MKNYEVYFLRSEIFELLIDVSPIDAAIRAALTMAGARDIDGLMEEFDKGYDADTAKLVEIRDALKEFSRLPRDEKEMKIKETMRQEINRALEEKGEGWMIAAMIEGSIGYHTPQHARKLIEQFKRGDEESWCERCIALFKCDLIRMMYHDVILFRRLEKRDPEKVKRLFEFVKKVEELDPEDQMAVSLMYPTMSI